MIRELLTNLSKVAKVLEERLDKLGLLGKVIGVFLGLFLFIGPPLIAILIIEQLFPRFWSFGDEQDINIAVSLLAVAIWGILYWLLASRPKDYVASKISDDIYDTLFGLNKCLNKAAKLGQNIDIIEGTDQKCQSFSVNFNKTPVKETEVISNLKSQILVLTKKLNKKLKDAEDRNLDVSIDLRYWGPEKMKESGQSQPYKYHFSASITEKNK